MLRTISTANRCENRIHAERCDQTRLSSKSSSIGDRHEVNEEHDNLIFGWRGSICISKKTIVGGVGCKHVNMCAGKSQK